MRTVIFKYDVYKFDELSDNAKQKVKDWYLSNDDMVYWFEEDIKNHMESIFGANHGLALQFSLSHSQGDGVNLYGIFNPQIVFNAIDNAPELFAEYKNELTDKQKAILLEYAKEYSNRLLAIDVNIPIEQMLETGWELFGKYFTPAETGIKEALIKKYGKWQ